jgi:hypothetical protein
LPLLTIGRADAIEVNRLFERRLDTAGIVGEKTI